MSQLFQSTEGIILKVIPFRDYDQIISLFTLDVGILKILYKGSRSKRGGIQGICMPLTKVEVIYREKKGEIFGCQEMTLLDSFSSLRKELLHLEVACDLLQTLSFSQLVGKPAPQLYMLLSFYLSKIPVILYPWTLAVSFKLKLLKYEGLTSFPLLCQDCQKCLQEVAYIREAEGWCEEHQVRGSQGWQKEELHLMYRLATCQNYREICQDQVSKELKNKVASFFEACLRK